MPGGGGRMFFVFVYVFPVSGDPSVNAGHTTRGERGQKRARRLRCSGRRKGARTGATAGGGEGASGDGIYPRKRRTPENSLKTKSRHVRAPGPRARARLCVDTYIRRKEFQQTYGKNKKLVSFRPSFMHNRYDEKGVRDGGERTDFKTV